MLTEKSEKRIAVLQLIAPTHFGGAERVVLDLAEAINDLKFKVVIGAFVNFHFRKNQFIERLKEKAISHEVFWLKRTIDFENIFKLIKFISREKINIIHTHGYRSDIIGLIAAKANRLPIVSTLHGWVNIDPRLRFYGHCDRFALRFFDRILPVSDQIKDDLAALRFKPHKISRLHNSVDIHLDHKLKKGGATHFKSSDDFLIGIIGRLSPEKNVAGFLEAARLLLPKFRKVKFLIVGDGPERQNLEKTAASQNLTGRIQFCGFVNDMEPIYQSLDLLVISSKTEGIPLVVLEAMKHAIPVVSTRVGGIPEIIEDGIDGMIVEPNDPRAIAAAIEILLKDTDRYREISRNAQAKIASAFNRSNWIGNIEHIYHELLK